MGPYGELTHKSLLPIRQKAALSHIIDAFGPTYRFVIAVGHFKSHVADYVALAHPGHEFELREITPISGPGSGPGRSLLGCQDLLSEGFYLACCDTLWSEPLDLKGGGNWLGTAPVPEVDSPQFCNVLRDEKGWAVSIVDKQQVPVQSNYQAFIGLARVEDTAIFFEGLKAGCASGDEVQLSSGFEPLMRRGLLATREVRSWVDVGTWARYQETLERDPGFDFSKPGEFTYCRGDRVIKFFADPSDRAGRVARAEMLQGLVPPLVGSSPNHLAYRHVPGKTFYESASPGLFAELMNWLGSHLWSREISPVSEFEKVCRAFYLDKTRKRVQAFLDDFPEQGSKGLSIHVLLAQVDWDELSRGHPSAFHGDLQFSNILCEAGTGRFKLIDWRRDFGASREAGDIHYDFAKLLAGIELDLNRIRIGDFTFREDADQVSFFVPRLPEEELYTAILQEFVEQAGFDFRKTRLLSALVYLNMAPLHKPPFSRLLFHLGKAKLVRELQV